VPRTEFGRIAQYAADRGYLSLTSSGGVQLDSSRNDRFSQQLQEMLRTHRDGTVLEEATPRPELDDATFQFIKRAHRARLEAARAAMERGWQRMGGVSSPVGLPVADSIRLEEQGVLGRGGYTASFRGGTLKLSSDGQTVSSESHTVVNIDLVGIECQIRQESTDEIYGVVSVMGPSNSTIITTRIPGGGTIDMGPDGLRINLTHVPLVKGGVLQNYYVWASLVENDSGDVDVIANKIADKFAETARAAVGALTGAPAESVSDSETFKENMATGLAWVFGDILGMGDDAYNAESFNLFWGDLNAASPAQQPPIRRDDDPRTIDGWTHKLILSGVDDGGDRGQYALYFKVWTEIVTVTTVAQATPTH